MSSRTQTLFPALFGAVGVLLVLAAAVFVFWPKVEAPKLATYRQRPPQPTLQQVPQDDANIAAYRQFWLEDQALSYSRRLEVAPPENKPALEALLKQTLADLATLNAGPVKVDQDGARFLPTRSNSD